MAVEQASASAPPRKQQAGSTGAILPYCPNERTCCSQRSLFFGRAPL
jgi:hypothetical protein